MTTRPPPPTVPAEPASGPPNASAGAQGDHWKKLLRPARKAVPVSVAQFVDELNRRLKADPCYRQGTRFIVASADDSRPGGSTWEGPESMKPVVSRIVQGAIGEFEVEHPFFSDR